MAEGGVREKDENISLGDPGWPTALIIRRATGADIVDVDVVVSLRPTMSGETRSRTRARYLSTLRSAIDRLSIKARCSKKTGENASLRGSKTY